MRRLLFLVSSFPKPLDSGGKLRDFYIINYLSRRFEVSIIGFRDRYLKARDIFLPSVPRKRCYIARKMKNINIITFLKRGHFPEWCVLYYAKELEKLLDSVIKRNNYDYIHVSHSFMAYHVLKYKDIIRVVDHHNVKTDLYRNALSRADNLIQRINYKAEYLKWHRYERDILNQFDFHISCSKHEQDAIRKFTNTPVELVPSGVDVQTFYPKSNPPTGNNLLFVGNLEYFPNKEALYFFCKECLPLIRRRLPNAVLQIVGRAPGETLKRFLKKTEGVWCSYNVEDIRPFYYQSTLVVIPLLTGAGTRLKILEALAAGLPVVSTSKGCEGLDIENSDGIIIEDDPERFSEAIIDILKNENLRIQLSRKAKQLASERFRWEVVLKPLDRIYA